MKNSLITVLISKFNFINLFLIILGLTFFDIDLKAHYKGQYLNESDAQDRAREIGCFGTFKIKKMWLPCANERELHKYLRKN